MALNIKNLEAEQLAHQLAAATGESLTGAVIAALRERLATVQGSDHAATAKRAERLRALSRDASRRWVEPFAGARHEDLLYDHAGLPK
jgi:antitoxin VapB